METSQEDGYSILTKDLSHEEAIVTVSLLDSDGIEVYLKTETLGGRIPGGVSNFVFVAAKDLERAKAILSATKDKSLELPARIISTPKWRIFFIRSFFAMLWLVTLVQSYSVGRRAGFSGAVSNERSREAFETASDGRRFRKFDNDHDGFYESKIFYNDSGEAIEEEIDSQKRGFPNVKYEYEKSSGKLWRSSEDTNFSGAFDKWTEYGTKGFPVKEYLDSNLDGVRDTEVAFDSNGRPAKIVVK